MPSSTTPVQYADAARTRALLPFAPLMQALAQAAQDLAAGRIQAPARQAVPLPTESGTMLSMPATAPDVSIHKLANITPANRALGLPTLNGVVSVYDSVTGQLRLLLDGPTVTTRRTAAVSMLGVQYLLPAPAPRHAAIFGTGAQAHVHAEALLALYPDVRIDVIGRTLAQAQAFAQGFADGRVRAADTVAAAADLLITATTSARPIYDEAARPERLVIGVGAYREDLAEIGARTLGASALYVDDLVGARHEAGDFIQAGIDWASVHSLADLVMGRQPARQPAVFKSVGCAAWDLAAARCALANAG
ncbi:delta(1)-pyrroline-2-carboxylate reductase family protein [Castellaniella caeni]|uniref:delta(1)-pyrroline-2-carboxylate reductase family protein n=1 Tax=Castellaniella caeni TaxID=266123 RepID=UPI000A65B8A5|nr:delta(1)-pyrroline-2-carboxylate reductase family protein [Castellaniella caeni]